MRVTNLDNGTLDGVLVAKPFHKDLLGLAQAMDTPCALNLFGGIHARLEKVHSGSSSQRDAHIAGTDGSHHHLQGIDVRVRVRVRIEVVEINTHFTSLYGNTDLRTPSVKAPSSCVRTRDRNETQTAGT
jgi:hypothetical protein